MMQRRKGPLAGFTLVELLVGLTLLGLIVVAVVGGLRIGIAGTERVSERGERLDELRGVHAFLRGRLEAARPVRWQVEGESVLAFAGAADQLSFVTDLPAYPDVGGLYKLTLHVEGGDVVLSRELTEGRAAGFDPDRGTKEILLEGVRSFRVAYFGVAPGDREPRWHDTWSRGLALPDLVRVRVEREGADAPWPEIVVSPQLGEQPR